MSLIDDFVRIEEELKLNSLEVDGYRFWQYNRFSLYSMFLNEKEGLIKGIDVIGTKQQIFRYLKNVPYVIILQIRRLFHNIRNGNKEYIVLRCHSRRQLINNLYVSPYTDLIFNEKDDTLTYEPSNSYRHYFPPYSNNIVYLDPIEIKARISYILLKYVRKNQYQKFLDDINPAFMNAIKELENSTGIHINYSQALNELVKHKVLVSAYEKFWKRQFKKYNVKCVCVLIGYALDVMSLAKIAHQYHVPVIEFQHGTINSEHIGYHYSTNNCFEKNTYTPDYIFTFGDIWSKQINMNSSVCLPVGFEYFLNQRDYFFSHNSFNNKNNVLIISQWTLGDRLSCVAEKLAELIEDKYPEWNVIFKLHPNEFQNAPNLYPNIFNKKHIKIMKNELHLYQLFMQSSALIGYNSTALFEGIGFGINAYFLRSSSSIVKEIVDKGMGFYIDDDFDFNILFQRDNQMETSMNIEQIWKSNAKENALLELNRILNDREV